MGPSEMLLSNATSGNGHEEDVDILALRVSAVAILNAPATDNSPMPPPASLDDLLFDVDLLDEIGQDFGQNLNAMIGFDEEDVDMASIYPSDQSTSAELTDVLEYAGIPSLVASPELLDVEHVQATPPPDPAAVPSFHGSPDVEPAQATPPPDQVAAPSRRIPAVPEPTTTEVSDSVASQDHPASLPAFLQVDDDDDEPAHVLRRLRRGDLGEVPQPPERHPCNNRINHYDPTEPWDYSKTCRFRRFVDRCRHRGKLCYLVEWALNPLQLSWVKATELQEYQWLMDRVDAWKASQSTKPFSQWWSKHKRASADDDQRCFIKTLQAACFDLRQPRLITTTHWNEFVQNYKDDLSEGVTKDDMQNLFLHLQHEDVALDYEALLVGRLGGSHTSIEKLCDYVRSSDLPMGHYIVGGEDDQDIQHCFVLVYSDPSEAIEVIDGYRDKESPPCHREPAINLAWFRKAIFMRLLRPGTPSQCRHGKRKTKSQKKREKRKRMSDAH